MIVKKRVYSAFNFLSQDLMLLLFVILKCAGYSPSPIF